MSIGDGLPTIDPLMPASLTALAYGRLVDVVAPLSARDCARPTRASGWCVADLVFHLLLDAQRALITLASPTSAACDRDAVDYWRDFPPGRAGAGEHADFVRRSVKAYRSPEALLRLFCTTASAAGRLARSCDPAGRCRPRGTYSPSPTSCPPWWWRRPSITSTSSSNCRTLPIRIPVCWPRPGGS